MKKSQRLAKIPTRALDSHKGSYGKVLILAGSKNMPGAAILCAKAATRGGAGLVQLAVPESIRLVVQCQLLDPVFLILAESPSGFVSPWAEPGLLQASKESQAVVIGPGLGQEPGVKKLLISLIPQLRIPAVIDADGINDLGEKLSILKLRKAPTILTPHPGEFARLLRIPVDAVQSNRAASASSFARKHHCIVVLKGHRTVVTDGNRLFVNSTGNPGMAKGGSGDVLAGLMGSLIARGLESFEAACRAVQLHGLAGDLAARELGQESMRASDLVDYLPDAFRKT